MTSELMCEENEVLPGTQIKHGTEKGFL